MTSLHSNEPALYTMQTREFLDEFMLNFVLSMYNTNNWDRFQRTCGSVNIESRRSLHQTSYYGMNGFQRGSEP